MAKVRDSGAARIPSPLTADQERSPVGTAGAAGQTARSEQSEAPAQAPTTTQLEEKALQERTGLGATAEVAANFAREAAPGQVAKQQLGVLGVLGAKKALDAEAEAEVEQQGGPAWGEKSVSEHARDFGVGIKEAALDTGQGLKDMAVGAWKMTAGFAYDREEAKATWGRFTSVVSGIVQNPKALLKALAEPYQEAWKEGRPMEAIGRGTFEAAAVLLTTKGLDKVSALAKGAKAAGLASGAAHSAAQVAGRMAGRVAENVAVRTAVKSKRIWEGGLRAAAAVAAVEGPRAARAAGELVEETDGGAASGERPVAEED